MPVAMIPNCAATRHAHFELDGIGAAHLTPPSLSEWPEVRWAPDYNKSKTGRPEYADQGRSRQLEARPDPAAVGQDADRPRRRAQAHPGHAGQGRSRCRSTSRNRVIYYVGPVDPVRDEVVGPAGLTTATCMDKFTDMMLDKTGLIAMIGKSERGPVAIEAIQQSSVGLPDGRSAAPPYLVSKAIRTAKVLGLRRPGHGSHLRVRRQGYARDRGRGCAGHLGAHDRPAGMAGQDREDPGCRGVRR